MAGGRKRSGGLALGLLLVPDPGVGLVEQFGQRHEVVVAEAIGFVPGIALLVTPAGRDAVPGAALIAGVLPYGNGQRAVAEFGGGLFVGGGFGGHGWSFRCGCLGMRAS